jgi:hypothetical protein
VSSHGKTILEEHNRRFTMKSFRCLFVLALPVLTGCTSTLVDFENLSTATTPTVPVGQKFHVGDIVTHNDTGVRIMVLPFEWASGTATSDGHVEVVQDHKSGGTGNEIHFNNACLGVLAPTSNTITKLELKFGEYGGNINLRVNGTLHNYQDLNQIPPGSLAPVQLSVSGYPLGVLTLTGPMDEFMIPDISEGPFTAVVGGGQELWIDDLEFWE